MKQTESIEYYVQLKKQHQQNIREKTAAIENSRAAIKTINARIKKLKMNKGIEA